MSEDEYPLLNNQSKHLISEKLIRTGEIITCTPLLIKCLRESELYSEASNKITDIIVGMVEQRANNKFHEGLTWFERNGFLSSRKEEAHIKSVENQKLYAAIATKGGVTLALYAIEAYLGLMEFNKIEEFFTGWAAYISHEMSLSLRRRVERLCELNGIPFKMDRFNANFDKYVTSRAVNLPVFPPSLERIKDKVYMAIVGGVDLNNSYINERAKELGEYLGYKEQEIEGFINQCNEGSEVVSNLAGFVGISLNNVLMDLAKDVEHAKSAAVYSIDNDPYHSIREERKQKIIIGSSLAMELAALIHGPLGKTVVRTAKPVFMHVLGTDPNTFKAISGKLAAYTNG